jgi:23S rRNA maturation mini-RNase III
MVDPINDPTPDPSGGNAPTPEPKEAAKKLEFTQDELDKKFAERQKRGEDAAAKRFQKQIDDLNSQIEEFKGKDLGELDKLKGKVEKLTKDLATKDTELSGKDLKLAKLEALLNAGIPSAKIPKLLKRVAGTTPEEIQSDVLELIEDLKLVEPEPEPQKGAKGAGHQQPKDPPGVKTFTRSQIKAMSPEEYDKNRDDIMKSMESGKIVS